MNNRDTSRVVIAASPFNNQQYIQLTVALGTLQAIVEIGLNSKIGEYLGLVHGNIRVKSHKESEIFEAPTLGIRAAHACFMGVKRPVGQSISGEHIAIYVLSAPHSYMYPDPADSLIRVQAPKQSVFTIGVDTENSKNEIIFWEWVLAGNDSLPEGHTQRYTGRQW